MASDRVRIGSSRMGMISGGDSTVQSASCIASGAGLVIIHRAPLPLVRLPVDGHSVGMMSRTLLVSLSVLPRRLQWTASLIGCVV